ncbi:MAG: DUF4328 domain-containing protein [Bacteroidota bacterium]
MSKFRVNSQRAKNAELLIIVSGVLSILSLISNGLEYWLLHSVSNGANVTMEQANFNDMRQLVIALVEILVFIFSAITFIQWFRRAYYNQETKFSFMATTNGWVSGAWFIPIYSLYRPFQLMKEIYQNLEEFLEKTALGESKRSRLQIVGWWWGLWVFANISQNIVTRVSSRVDQVDSLMYLSFTSMIVDLIYIVLAFLTIKMIRNYNEMELILLSTSDDVEYNTSKSDQLLDSNM